MGKLSTAAAFLSGAAAGGAAVWYMVRERYARLADEEIRSVKEAYAQIEAKKAEEALRRYQGEGAEASDDTQESKTPVVTARVAEKGSIADYAKRIQNGVPMEYSKTIMPPRPGAPEESARSENSGDISYVISPDEFGELDGYTPISLTCFADGVLADEYGIIVDNVEEIIGDGLDHFGEYEDDAVFVRNDVKRCDYEILRDEREYAEFRKTLPPNI